MSTYLNTALDHGCIIMTCPRTKQLVAHIEYDTNHPTTPYRVSYCGPLAGLPGRHWARTQAAEYGVLAEYINRNP